MRWRQLKLIQRLAADADDDAGDDDDDDTCCKQGWTKTELGC